MSKSKCAAEIADRKRMRTLPKGRLAWKGCSRVGTATRVTPRGTVLIYCDKHKDAKGHGGECKS